MEVGTIYPIPIVDVGSKGEGIGKFDNLTVFIDGALKGDKVLGKIKKIKSHYAIADLVGIAEESPLRCKPECSLAHICGGCQIMQMKYEEQLHYKENAVFEALRRIGAIENFEKLPIIPMEHPYAYRNKAQFPVERSGDNRVKIGFYERKSHKIVPVEKCPIQHPVNEKILEVIRNFFKEHNVSIYDEKTRKGNLKRIITRVGFKSGEVMIGLVTAVRDFPWKKELIDNLKEKIPHLKTIVQNLHPHPTNAVIGKENLLLYGDGIIRESIGDLCFEIALGSFFQVNPAQTEVIYKKALEFAEVDQNQKVIDIYCGAGSISLFLAQKAGEVIGIECVPSAIEDAKRNALNNNITNATFRLGKAEDLLPKLYKEGLRADVVVVDPPRKGCEEAVLDTIGEIQPQRVVYVSCNPATLARDAAILEQKGYKAVKVQSIDNFPHSVHVETVTLLSKVDVDKQINVEMMKR